jgi:hypothetical protein
VQLRRLDVFIVCFETWADGAALSVPVSVGQATDGTVGFSVADVQVPTMVVSIVRLFGSSRAYRFHRT